MTDPWVMPPPSPTDVYLFACGHDLPDDLDLAANLGNLVRCPVCLDFRRIQRIADPEPETDPVHLLYGHCDNCKRSLCWARSLLDLMESSLEGSDPSKPYTIPGICDVCEGPGVMVDHGRLNPEGGC